MKTLLPYFIILVFLTNNNYATDIPQLAVFNPFQAGLYGINYEYSWLKNGINGDRQAISLKFGKYELHYKQPISEQRFTLNKIDSIFYEGKEEKQVKVLISNDIDTLLKEALIDSISLYKSDTLELYVIKGNIHTKYLLIKENKENSYFSLSFGYNYMNVYNYKISDIYRANHLEVEGIFVGIFFHPISYSFKNKMSIGLTLGFELGFPAIKKTKIDSIVNGIPKKVDFSTDNVISPEGILGLYYSPYKGFAFFLQWNVQKLNFKYIRDDISLIDMNNNKITFGLSVNFVPPK